jgi:hypothetical protein
MNLPPRRENSGRRIAKARAAWSSNGGASNPSTDPVFTDAGDYSRDWYKDPKGAAESYSWDKGQFDPKFDN